MGYTAAALARTLATSAAESYVRVVADWLDRGEIGDAVPPLTNRGPCDALVAAAVAHRARSTGGDAPAWTYEPARHLPSFWHPGSDAFFAYALAHSPAEFRARGVLIEAGSLVSV